MATAQLNYLIKLGRWHVIHTQHQDLEDLQKDCQKVCYTFCGKVFMTSNTSSQRGESIHVYYKGEGVRKAGILQVLMKAVV